MKTKFYWLALLASAAMIAQAKAGAHGGGGVGFGGGAHFAPAASAGRPVSSFNPMPAQHFGGNRMIYSGERFAPPATAYRSRSVNSNANALAVNRQFTHQNINRSPNVNRLTGANRVQRGNNLPGNWRNHVVAQHSANWHNDWDRHHDHVWNGHHCRFINGSWVIFDYGFYPWWPYDSYAYGYYPYNYYPYSYGYDPNEYDSDVDQGQPVYGYNSNDSSVASGDATVAAVQQQLSRQGYYRDKIDGILGPETQRAITRYQSSHGLRVTGSLTKDTVAALGLHPVAAN